MVFWYCPHQCCMQRLYSPPPVFILLASSAVLSIHTMGVSLHIPAFSWRLDMAYVTAASLTWHLHHEGGFR